MLPRFSACAAVMLLAPLLPFSPALAQGDRALCIAPGTPADKLIQACTNVIESGHWTHTDLAWAYNNRGVGYGYKGADRRAIGEFDQALKLKPNYPRALLNRGNVYARLGEPAKALEDYAQAIKLNPEDANAFRVRCYVQAMMGRFGAALRDCDRALQLAPGDARVLESRGSVHLLAGRQAQAIADYTKALTAEPKLAVARFGRGLARLQGGDAGGKEDLDAARGLQPGIDEEMARIGLRVPPTG